MKSARAAYWAVVLGIAGALLLTGPVVGLDVTEEPAQLGGGNATVTDVTLVDGPSIQSGRFGTDRVYVRGATARVTVRSVTGTPRIVLRTEVPGLQYDGVTTRVLEQDTRGTVQLSVRDRPFESDAVPFEDTEVRTTVRVQSFDGDWVVFARNETVEGRR